MWIKKYKNWKTYWKQPLDTNHVLWSTNTDNSTSCYKTDTAIFFTWWNGELVPELVEKYETLPDNSIILTLKRNIFQDGKEMKAEDVKQV